MSLLNFRLCLCYVRGHCRRRLIVPNTRSEMSRHRQFHQMSRNREDFQYSNHTSIVMQSRLKTSKKGITAVYSDDESDDDDDNQTFGKGCKVVHLQTTSMRLDAIVKHGLNLSRNKVEVIFYESRIRKNGQKIFKKSDHVNVGDEIDVIKTVSDLNPNFLTVSRIEVLAAKPVDDCILVKVRKTKSLLIENYADAPWKVVEEKQ